ncbi:MULTISPECIES: DoxX family protein [Kitasatospora]|uniref:DoxX family protein n=1 Tax=Kitasatospora TaxID=2063 RepID=UPI000C7054FE|nr:DoxX family protein [Kitasatospora sp. GP30]MDH6138948.1 putative oxidoreductase [Kitasatospora sp. GP30]
MGCVNRKDLGLLVLRAAVGGVLFSHGTQKLFGWFGGGGLEGTAKAMESMGFKPGGQSALAAGLGEAGGGALLVAGLATPVAGPVVAGTMAGAASVHFPHGFFVTKGGYEYPALLGVCGLALGIAGPGRYSLDELTGNAFNRSVLGALSFAAAAAGAYAVVTKRERAVREAAAKAMESEPE